MDFMILNNGLVGLDKGCFRFGTVKRTLSLINGHNKAIRVVLAWLILKSKLWNFKYCKLYAFYMYVLRLLCVDGNVPYLELKAHSFQYKLFDLQYVYAYTVF